MIVLSEGTGDFRIIEAAFGLLEKVLEPLKSSKKGLKEALTSGQSIFAMRDLGLKPMELTQASPLVKKKNFYTGEKCAKLFKIYKKNTPINWL